MKFTIVALFALCLNMQASAQNTQEEPKFYKVSIVELSLPAEGEPPISLDVEISPNEMSWFTGNWNLRQLELASLGTHPA